MNIAIKEIYFDPRFPSLADLDCPHVITVVTPTSHDNIEDFPAEITIMPLFQKLFNKNNLDKEYGMFQAPAGVVHSTLDYKVFFEIDSRFGYAYSISVLRDIAFKSPIEAIRFINEHMFPFHKVSPISINNSGRVSFNSNLDVFMSDTY